MVSTLLEKSHATSLITPDDLAALPAPVQRYLRYTGVVGRPRIKTAHAQYEGQFRLKRDQRWMHIVAEQDYTVNPPGFVWNVRFKMAGVPFMFGQDTYAGGHSRMHGKLFGLFTVVDGYGDEVDQGTMVRYLQEILWFPTAYLENNIHWDAVDDHAADVTFTAYGQSVTGRMFFDDTGRLLSFAAQRYGEFDGKYDIRTWTTPITEYGHYAGLTLPSVGTGVWLLPDGDLAYVTYRLKGLFYDYV